MSNLPQNKPEVKADVFEAVVLQVRPSYNLNSKNNSTIIRIELRINGNPARYRIRPGDIVIGKVAVPCTREVRKQRIVDNLATELRQQLKEERRE